MTSSRTYSAVVPPGALLVMRGGPAWATTWVGATWFVAVGATVGVGGIFVAGGKEAGLIVQVINEEPAATHPCSPVPTTATSSHCPSGNPCALKARGVSVAFGDSWRMAGKLRPGPKNRLRGWVTVQVGA